MGAARRGISVALAVGALAVLTAPAAYADNPPCRMTPREFRNVRVANYPKRGMTRKFVQQMVECGGKTVFYEEFGGYSIRQVTYRRTAPAGSVAWIMYTNDRAEAKGWATSDTAVLPPFGVPFPFPTD